MNLGEKRSSWGFMCGVGRKQYTGSEGILIRMFYKCDSVGKTDNQRAQ